MLATSSRALPRAPSTTFAFYTSWIPSPREYRIPCYIRSLDLSRGRIHLQVSLPGACHGTRFATHRITQFGLRPSTTKELRHIQRWPGQMSRFPRPVPRHSDVKLSYLPPSPTGPRAKPGDANCAGVIQKWPIAGGGSIYTGRPAESPQAYHREVRVDC